MTQQVMGGQKLKKRLTNKKREKAEKLHSFTTRYLALCKETGHMLFATLKAADPMGTMFGIDYKVRTYEDDKVVAQKSVELQDALIELEQTGKIEKGSEEHKAKVAEIEAEREKELQVIIDALPNVHPDDEEREIRYETAIKIQDLLILSKDKEEGLKAILKYVNSLYQPKVEVVEEKKEAEATTA